MKDRQPCISMESVCNVMYALKHSNMNPSSLRPQPHDDLKRKLPARIDNCQMHDDRIISSVLKRVDHFSRPERLCWPIASYYDTALIPLCGTKFCLSGRRNGAKSVAHLSYYYGEPCSGSRLTSTHNSYPKTKTVNNRRDYPYIFTTANNTEAEFTRRCYYNSLSLYKIDANSKTADLATTPVIRKPTYDLSDSFSNSIQENESKCKISGIYRKEKNKIMKPISSAESRLFTKSEKDSIDQKDKLKTSMFVPLSDDNNQSSLINVFQERCVKYATNSNQKTHPSATRASNSLPANRCKKDLRSGIPLPIWQGIQNSIPGNTKFNANTSPFHLANQQPQSIHSLPANSLKEKKRLLSNRNTKKESKAAFVRLYSAQLTNADLKRVKHDPLIYSSRCDRGKLQRTRSLPSTPGKKHHNESHSKHAALLNDQRSSENNNLFNSFDSNVTTQSMKLLNESIRKGTDKRSYLDLLKQKGKSYKPQTKLYSCEEELSKDQNEDSSIKVAQFGTLSSLSPQKMRSSSSAAMFLSQDQLVMKHSVEKVQRWIKGLPKHFDTRHHLLPPVEQDPCETGVDFCD